MNRRSGQAFGGSLRYMKRVCATCGRVSDQEASHCSGCGAAFHRESLRQDNLSTDSTGSWIVIGIVSSIVAIILLSQSQREANAFQKEQKALEARIQAADQITEEQLREQTEKN